VIPPAPTSKPIPAPPPPIDEPKMSMEEVKKYVWAELPLELPGNYEKHQLDLSTLEANY
jgi:hypothetical protein